MRRGTPGFVGARLREAREVRGLPAIALSELVNVSGQAISQYETGRSSPSAETFDALSRALNIPRHFFLRPLRPGAPAKVFYRSMASATKAARARARGRSAWLRDIVAYLSEYVELPVVDFPDFGIDEPLGLTDLEIDEAAAALRKHWRMGEGPIANVVLLLENQGAVVATDKLGADTLDGLSEFAPNDRPYIIIGTDKGSSPRWRYDAAHELAHMVLHTNLDPQALLRPADFKRVEQQAHRFAGAFLLPAEQFGDDLFGVNLDALRALKPKWKVSIAMMIIRARDAGLLSEDAERRLWINYSRRKWRREEPYDDDLELERPTLLRRAFEMTFEAGEQTPGDMLMHLALPAADVEALASVQQGFLDQDFTPVMLRSSRPGGATSSSGEPADVIPFPQRPRSA